MGSRQIEQLLRHKRIAIDTNIFVYALENNQSFPEIAHLLDQITRTRKRVYTSVTTLSEIFVPLFRLRQLYRIPKYLDFIGGQGKIMIIDVDQAIALRAAQVRANYGLITADALHVASALQCKATAFITADRDYGEDHIEQMQIFTLRAQHI